MFLRRKSEQEKLAESLSGEVTDYRIFMAIAKAVGKDRRGNITFVRDEHGREVVHRELYETFRKSTILDYLPIVEPSGRIVDDDLPHIARKYLQFNRNSDV